MARKVVYWTTTALVAASGFLAAFAYLSGGQQAVEGFAHVGYPQQLRILLGIAKPLGAIALLIPGWPKLKEWAYAGFTFAWIAAFFAHYLAGDGPRHSRRSRCLYYSLCRTSPGRRADGGAEHQPDESCGERVPGSINKGLSETLRRPRSLGGEFSGRRVVSFRPLAPLRL